MTTPRKIVLLTIMPLLMVALNLNAQDVWEGDVSSDWGDDLNWVDGSYPDFSDDVVIPAVVFPNVDPIIKTDLINQPFQCGDLTIAGGATLTIIEEGNLDIEGNVDNSGDIIIEDNGNFFQDFGTTYTDNGGTGTFTLSRTGTSDALKFNMWSSPVDSQHVNAFSGNAYRFNPISSTSSTADDDNDPGWLILTGSTGTAVDTMTKGRGYACAGCGTVTFSGVPNNGPLSVAVSYHGGPGVPYNLIGNPYPSPLDIFLFLGDVNNSNDLATNAVYLWDNPGAEPYSTSDYATINQAGTITSNSNQATYSSPYTMITTGQGFFVEIDPGTDGDMDFDNNMRGTGFEDNTQFYKQQADMQRIWLGVTDKDSTVYNEILVAFTDSATAGFDKKYDAKKLEGNSKLSLYSLGNSKHYAIQGLPYLNNHEMEVPVGILLGNSNTITFSLKWEENLEDYDVYLKDKQTGIRIDLRSDNYSLSIQNGEHNERFSIVMTSKNATGINELTKSGLSITHSDGVLHIANLQDKMTILENIRVFDISGKMIKEWSNLDLNNLERLSLPFAPHQSGYYIVKARGNSESVQQKIRIIN